MLIALKTTSPQCIVTTLDKWFLVISFFSVSHTFNNGAISPEVAQWNTYGIFKSNTKEKMSDMGLKQPPLETKKALNGSIQTWTQLQILRPKDRQQIWGSLPSSHWETHMKSELQIYYIYVLGASD